MKTKLFVALILLFTIIGASAYYNQMHQKVVDLQKFINVQQERIAVADAAIQVYRYQEAEKKLPELVADIELPPHLSNEFSMYDVSGMPGIKARQPVAFRGTGFNLYYERATRGRVYIFYENTKPAPIGELHGNAVEFKSVRLANSPTAFRVPAPIRNKDVKRRSAN